MSAVEFFRLFGEPSRDKLRLASAVLMSSTFPYVTSAAALPTDPPRHVVDAGYYDNYGVNLAAEWISSHRFWIGSEHIRSLARPGPSVSKRTTPEDARRRDPGSAFGQGETRREGLSIERAARFLPWLVSLLADGLKSVVLPVEGIAKARDSSMYFRNDEQLGRAADDVHRIDRRRPVFSLCRLYLRHLPARTEVAKRRNPQLVHRPS